jgi:hypothetical protein
LRRTEVFEGTRDVYGNASINWMQGKDNSGKKDKND